MKRKWSLLAASLCSLSLVVGLAVAQDPQEMDLEAIMKKVQKNHGANVKVLKTAVSYKKGQKELVTQTEELTKLVKSTKDFKEPSGKVKGTTQKQWTELVDSFLKQSEDFTKIAKDAGPDDQTKTKDAYKKVNAQCSACHEVFKKED